MEEHEWVPGQLDLPQLPLVLPISLELRGHLCTGLDRHCEKVNGSPGVGLGGCSARAGEMEMAYLGLH